MRKNVNLASSIGLGVFLVIILLSNTAFAAESTGGALPYEGWLKTLQQSLTGPVAFSVAMIGIVTCGATLILSGGEIGRFMQSLIFLVLVMTLLIGANALMTRFFNGASIGVVHVQNTTHQRLAFDDFNAQYLALINENQGTPALPPANLQSKSKIQDKDLPLSLNEAYDLYYRGKRVIDTNNPQEVVDSILREISFEGMERTLRSVDGVEA